jgi:hypothetical protein
MSYDGPGIYNMSEREYFADPVPGGSLSHSGAKLILEAPAKFKHDVLDCSPTPPTDAMIFGSAVHCAVLNPQDRDELVVVVDSDTWRGKDVQEARKDAIAADRAPVLAKDWAKAERMAEVVRAHPIAGQILGDPDAVAERSLFWEADGITKRARVDFMGGRNKDRYVWGDYKTTPDASPLNFPKSVVNYGYHTQQAHYGEGIAALTGERDAAFIIIAQEKTEPYLVTVFQLWSDLVVMGEQRMQRAVQVYKRCMETGEWPGYSDTVEKAVAPTWADYEHAYNLEQWGMAS